MLGIALLGNASDPCCIASLGVALASVASASRGSVSLDVGLLGVALAGIALALRGSVALGIASCRLTLHRLGFTRYRLAPHCPAWHRAVWHPPGFGWHCEVLLGIVSLGIALRGAA